MLVFIAGGVWKLTPRDDVRLLQSTSPDLIQTADKIRLLLQIRDSQFFLVVGKDLQDWQRNEQGLLARLKELQQHKAIKSFDGVSSYWPDPDRQRDSYQLLKQTLYDTGLAKRYMSELSFSDDAIDIELKQFNFIQIG